MQNVKTRAVRVLEEEHERKLRSAAGASKPIHDNLVNNSQTKATQCNFRQVSVSALDLTSNFDSLSVIL